MVAFSHRNTTRMTIRWMIMLAVLLSVLVAPAATFAAHTHAAHTLSIAAARALPLGSTVTVQGAVTVPSGAFRSGTFDEGFAIQDRSGGIYVSIATNLGLALCQEVRVTGQLLDSFGLLTLVVSNPADVKPLGHGPTVVPKRLRTNAISEASEGRLVEVAGKITQPVASDLPYGYRLFVDDGSGVVQVFVYVSTGINVSSLAVGQRVRVIGFSSQFDTHYEINPRIPGDIRPG